MIGIIFLVILIFGILIFVHELGHFVAARRNGVNVEEFGFGFPPRIFKKQIGQTVYSINLIPLGGFVKLQGEDGNDRRPGSFGAASFWAKTKILLAGVTMNLLLAYLILVGLCLTGLPPIIQHQFSVGKPIYAQVKSVMAVEVVGGSPADDAGIKRGDLILGANGQRFDAEQNLLDFTKSHAGEKVNLEVSHHGQTRDIQVQLKQPGSKDGYLGVTPFQTYQLRYAFWQAPVVAGGILLQLMWATLAAFGGLIAGLFIHGQISNQVTGPVGIVVILKNIVDLGLAYILVFVLSISVSLGVINAMPLPALDGGRWAIALAQKVTRRQLSPQAEGMVHAIGFALLMVLMAVITIFDINRLGS